MRVSIPRKLLDTFYQLLEWSNEEFVGFLLGRDIADYVTIEELVLCENVERSPYSFRVSPYAVLETYGIAGKFGLDVVALIHSHPAIPYPSSRDLAGMRLWNVIWVIVDSLNRSVRAWRLVDGRVVEVDLLIT